MRHSFWWGFYLWAILHGADFAVASPQPKAARPNIILILADDMGFSDLGCYGSEIATPNLDKLAAHGLRFTQFYNAARCCPTRAALLTGVYPHQAGIGHMMQDRGTPAYRGELSDRCVTIAETLRASGYRTGMVGKWHVAHIRFFGKEQLNFETQPEFWDHKNNWPLQRGFDEYFGTIHGVNSYYDPFSLVRGNTPIRAEGTNFYYTDAISDEAVRFLDRHGTEAAPFFLYVAYTAPHWPLQARPDEIAKYEKIYRAGWDEIRRRRYERQIKLGIVDRKFSLSPRDERVPAWDHAPNKEWEARRMAVYAAMIDRLDQGVGKILVKLKELKANENTLVMFLSDNGGCAEDLRPNFYDVPTKTRDGRPIKIGNTDASVMAGPEDVWQSYGIPWANVSNTPFRFYKHWVHEGGIATPFIVSWPATIKKEGRITPETGHVIDILPTCLEVAGATYPEKFQGHQITPIEGTSLLSVFRGNPLPAREPIFWEHEGNRAVRSGQWKLVMRYHGDWELYDMKTDRSELHNLAAKNLTKVQELSSLYEKWAVRCGVVSPESLK